MHVVRCVNRNSSFSAFSKVCVPALHFASYHTTKRVQCSPHHPPMAEVLKAVLPERLQPGAPKQQKKEKKGKGGDDGDSGPMELESQPAFIKHRIELFEKLKKKADEELAAKPRESITITFPDGKIQAGTSWETKPGDIARGISKSLFERVFISKVDGELWDLERPLEASCTLEFLDFEDPEAKRVFWHSSAHILGEAAERRFGCDLCIGPPVEDGFYYEMALPDQAAVKESDYKPLKAIAEKAIKEKQPFERLTLSKDDLLEMFKSNKYKQHIIKDKIADGTSTTVYRCGPLIDLCRGPHVPHTGRIKAFEIMKNSASYFLGDPTNDSLQRIYGVSFPDKKQLEEHKKYLEEAAKRDHRKIGREQELFFFNDLSPGSCFFLPHGAIIYNTLQAFIREQYWKRGYQEVITPNMYNSELWKQSGHWQHYHEDMFTFDVEKDKWALKPMNCPGHCIMFGHRERSYRELPMRFADFGVLHRNEASGALTGLTRVRRFQQDDAHIFCTQDQIDAEISDLFDFLRTTYGMLGFAFKLKLSTRPEKFLGDVETWNEAEAKLTRALDKFTAEGGAKWELNPGDGAFYGPKIDVTISDALRREFQCATLQLDFQLPQQFNLEYMTPAIGTISENADPKTDAPAPAAPASAEHLQPDLATQPHPPASAPAGASKEKEKSYRKPLTPGYARPVMIHRAMVGSFERFIAILCEHFAGKWPFWLSPRQVLIIPVMSGAYDYCKTVQARFREHGFHADTDLSGNTLQKKIRTGQLQQYNYILVLGAEEMNSNTVNVRDRDDQSKQQRTETITIEECLKRFGELKEKRTGAAPALL